MGVKISELPNNSLPYTGSEEIPLIQSGETRAGTLSSFVNYLSGDLLADTELAALSGVWQDTYTSYSTNSATFVTYTGATQDVDLGSNNLTTTGYVSAGTAFAESLTANNFTALSATINVVDITEYELSGFSVSGAVAVSGDLDLEGNTTLNGDLTVDTNTLHVDSSNNRVGIGTTTPLSALDVNGPVKITGDTDTNSNAALAVYASDGTSRFEIRDNGRWVVNNSSGTQRASYQPSSYGGAGLLNLGTGRLWCNAFTVNSGAISFGTGSSNTSDITFTANGATAFKIEGTTGDLEIGSSNSLTYADNSGAWDGASFTGNQAFTGDLTVDSTTLHVDSSNNRVGIGTASPSYAFDQVGNAALGSGTVYVDSGGSVGIGTTSPSYALDIPFGDINVGGYVYTYDLSVANNATVTGYLACSTFYDGGGGGQWGSESSGDFTFNNSVNVSTDLSVTGDLTVDSTLLSIDSTANSITMDTDVFTLFASSNRIGIGTASPSYNNAVTSSWPIYSKSTAGFIHDTTGVGFRASDNTTTPLYVEADDSSSYPRRIVAIENEDDEETAYINIEGHGDGTTWTFPDHGGELVTTLGTQSIGGAKTFSDNAVFSSDLTVDTNTLHVDSSNNRVGIGTASPSYAFDQAGDAALGSGTLYVDSSNFRVGIGTTSPSYALDNQGDASLGSGTLHVDSASNYVGILTTSPSYALDIPFGDINVGGFINVGSDVTITSNLYCSSFHDAGGVGGQWGSESSGDFTFNGGVNISGQAEATNQAASTDDSLMTRSLVDTDRWLNSARLWSPLVIPSFTNSGTGSVSQTSAGDAWVSLQSGTSNSGYGKAVIGRGLNSAPGISGAGIFFNRPVGLSCNIAFFTANNESNRIRLVIGTDTSAPAAAGDDPISDDGFGVEIKRNATHTQWRVFAHNGTTLTATAFANLYTGTRLQPQTLAVYSDSSGNITAYYGNYGTDSFSTITTTGGPTGTGASATSRASIEAANSSSGTSTSKANVYSCKFYTPND